MQHLRCFALLKRLKPQDIAIFSRVIGWHEILSPPDLAAPSIERDDVHTGSYGKYTSFQSKLRRNFALDAWV